MSETTINREDIVKVIKTVYDPEIPSDIYELGLIYDIQINEQKEVTVQMTLTSPNCPAAESIPVEVKQKIERIEGINQAHVEIVWEPPWNPQMMSDEAKIQLGFM
ncbi:MAG: SUF system Fe-S cluster assembly protein [Caldithrix sp.]|nr:SUF system Fe-S cluster assembly protein [Caldithrix sp.]